MDLYQQKKNYWSHTFITLSHTKYCFGCAEKVSRLQSAAHLGSVQEFLYQDIFFILNEQA